MKGYIKDAAFILAVFAVAKLINNSVNIPVIGAYLPK